MGMSATWCHNQLGMTNGSDGSKLVRHEYTQIKQMGVIANIAKCS